MESKERDYRDGRFEFAFYVNNNIIAKRNFSVPNYVDKSMQTVEFKDIVDEIVEMAKRDLKSKSMVYTTYYFWPDDERLTADDLKGDLLAPWECTFKFTITDRGREVISKIWDGYCYPRTIREKVDLTNKWVRFTNSEGKTFTYEKESYFKERGDRLSSEMYVIREMIQHKGDVLQAIIRRIVDACSGGKTRTYQTISNFTRTLEYGDKVYTTDIKGYNNKLAATWTEEVIKKNEKLKAERKRRP